MPDSPDWTGQQSLVASPTILQDSRNGNLVGAAPFVTNFVTGVTATTRVRVFSLTMEPSTPRYAHFVSVEVLAIPSNTPVAYLWVSPNKPVDQVLFSPPYDMPVGDTPQIIGHLMSPDPTDGEFIIVTLDYAIVGP